MDLHLYDIYPKVIKTHNQSQITVEAVDYSRRFTEGQTYTIIMVPLFHGRYHTSPAFDQMEVVAKDNKLVFEYNFGDEQEYYVRILNQEGNRIVQLSVYAVNEDLYTRRPYKGDLHVHSCFSDGNESPEFVAAMYRRTGFDFMGLTDHYQYEPSLRAINAYKDAPIAMTILPGEEVHAPGNITHIVHFGGDFSVNSLYRDHPEVYAKEVAAIEATLECPEGVDPKTYASCLWVYEKIKEANGLSIYPHPHWINDAYNVPDAMTMHQFREKRFDAFELLGGQSSEENNMQLSIYAQAREEGIANIPVVGSSDSHSTLNGRWFDEAKTIVFAHANEKDALFEAIRGQYTTAIESYHGEHYKVHGNHRLTSYTLFLLREYFPLHDELCIEEGRAMLGYVRNEPEALQILELTQSRTSRLLEKYFG